MARYESIRKLRTALLFSIVVDALYGIGFLVTPGMLHALAGGNALEFGWVRWSGGALVAMAIGGIQVYRDPHKQGSAVTILTVGALLSALALLYTLLFEQYSVHTWFVLAPCVLLFALFLVMAWGRQAAKDIL